MASTLLLPRAPVDASIIICHHKGTALLQRCLAALAQSIGVTFETFVVTSADGPDLNWWQEGIGLRKLWEAGGPAHKRNVGARHARGRVLVFLDDDAEVSPYCVSELVSWLDHTPGAGMAYAKIYNAERRQEFDDCGSWLTWTGFLYARAGDDPRDCGQYDEPCRILASKSATCAIRRDTFFRVGGFDAAYYILGEESDLSWRVWLAGQQVWYVPTAVSWHWFNTTKKATADYYTLQRIHSFGARNYLRLLTTNLGTLRLVRTLPLHGLIWLLAVLGFCLRGQPARAAAILAGVHKYLTTLPQTLAKRRQVQGSRVIRDRDLMDLVLHRPGLRYYLGRMRRYLVQALHG